MRLLVIAAAVLAVAVAWLSLGRHISAFLDRLGAVESALVPLRYFGVDQTHLILNSRRWILPPQLRFLPDSRSRLSASMSGRTVELGPVLRCSGDFYEFRPDAGDQVSLERKTSRVSWATPFAFSLIGSRPPVWHRYYYHRLLWRKANGASLELVWQDREDFFPSSGWVEQYYEIRPRVELKGT